MQIALEKITRETVAFGRPLDFVATVYIDGLPEFAVAADGIPDGIVWFEWVTDRISLDELDEATAGAFDRLTVGGMSVDPTFRNLCLALATDWEGKSVKI